MRYGLFLMLATHLAHAYRVDVWDPHDPRCGKEFGRLVHSPLQDVQRPSEPEARSSQEAVDRHWEGIGPYYEAMVKDPVERAFIQAADRKMSKGRVAYLVARNEQTGAEEGWVRVVSRRGGVGSFGFDPKAPDSAVPMERYPGLGKYLDQKHPHRLEVGRLATDKALGRNRPAAWAEMLATILGLANKPPPKEPTSLVIDVSDKSFFAKFGFEEVSAEEIRKTSPEFEMLPGHSLMVADVRKLFLRLGGGDEPVPVELPLDRAALESAMASLDAVVENLPEGTSSALLPRLTFERARTLLALDRLEEARKEIKALNRRDPYDPDVRALTLLLEALDAQRNGAAFPGAGEPVLDPIFGIELGDYYRAWTAVESGHADASRFVGEMESRRRAEKLAGEKRGVQVHTIAFENLGENMVDELQSRFFDPVTGRGDAQAALFAVDQRMQQPPYGITRAMHLYRSAVLAHLGQAKEAAAAKARAARIPVPKDRAVRAPVIWEPPTDEAASLQAFHLLTSRGGVSAAEKAWKTPSAFFPGERLTADRLDTVIDHVFQNREAQSELAGVIEGLGGMQSPNLWNLYFDGPYDKVVAYSDGYRQMMLGVDRLLPTKGRVKDYGTGTGNYSSFLKFRAQGRHVISADTSDGGLATTAEKMRSVSGGGVEYSRVKRDITQPGDQPSGSLAGGLMTNVLYAVEPGKRAGVLADAYRELAPGAALALIDPAPRKHSPAELKALVRSIGESALRNGSTLSEKDLALLAHINLQILANPSSRFQTPEQMKALAQSVGFEVEKVEEVYYGGANFYVLRKPKPAR